MVRGAHFVLYSSDPAADRALFRDLLRLPSVDAGDGWLIFRLPDAEVAIHPAGAVPPIHHGGDAMPGAILYLMCDDLKATMQELGERGARFTAVSEAAWGSRTALLLPSGAAIGLYQPSHATAVDLRSRRRPAAGSSAQGTATSACRASPTSPV